MAFRDIGRVLGLPYGYVDMLCKMIPFDPSRPLSLEQAIAQEPRIRKEEEKDVRIKKLVEISKKLEGLNRNMATHAAGVVIPAEKLAESIAENAPISIRSTIKLVNNRTNTIIQQGLLKEQDEFTDLFITDDTAEGLAAVIEKRKPEFKGE